MKKYILKSLLALLLFPMAVRADEGMWPLTLLAQLQNEMQAKGLKLSAEDIYSINKSCLKDAVVRLQTKQGRMFCSGEIISEQGLFLTNHHCGYGAIQELSTPQNNYLKYGYWAQDQSKELPANFHISLLAKVEDVSPKVLELIDNKLPEADRMKSASKAVKTITDQLTATEKEAGNTYRIEIVPFYNGNRYLAMYYVVYQDVRLVGTPPENIGKFGGETDNWMWPRHTADFSMFRIYVNKDNKPAPYSAENVPYKPAHYFPVSLKGTQEGDFAMIMGYPGRTNRYVYSEGVKLMTSKDRPARVKLRRKVLDIYEEFMHKDSVIRLMYADKYAGLSNYWKKFMGERDGLKKLNIYDRRKAIENEFSVWMKANGRESEYGELFKLYNEGYETQNQYIFSQIYLGEGLMNVQAFANAAGFIELYDSLSAKKSKAVIDRMLAPYKEASAELFREFYLPIEEKACAAMMEYLYEDVDHRMLPDDFLSLAAKYKHNWALMAKTMFAKSIFTNQKRFEAFLAKPDAKKLGADLVFKVIRAYILKYNQDYKPAMDAAAMKIARASRLLVAGLLEMNPDKIYAPDANATMRLTYGSILDYDGNDAVHFKNFTTQRGVLEKYKPGDIEFDAPKKLIDLLKNKDFGQYADKDGNLHTCFLSSNDITGGNSGSPVLNANGELIGTAFDGNWEAISSDFAFETDLQRTISLDIRYTLFILDKFGGAGHLLNEMKIIR